MATADEYANWIVANADKKGTPEFDVVAKAYQAAKNAQIKPQDPTEGMSGTEKFLAGTGKAFMDVARGAGQLVGAVSQKDIDEERRLTEPLMRSGAAKAGNILGNVAAFAPTALIPGANTYAGAALIGAGSGLLAPVGSDEDSIVTGKLKSSGINAALAPATILGGRAIGGAIQGGKSVLEPFYQSGQNQIVGRTLSRFSENPTALAAQARAAQPPVAGVQQTFAEATMDPGAATLQRAAQSISPDTAIALQNRQLANNAAMVDALKSIGGDQAAMDAAIAARKQATAPLYSAVGSSTAIADPSRVVNLIDRIVEKNPANKPLVSSMTEIRNSLFEEYPAQQRASDAWKSLTQDLQTKMNDANRNIVSEVRTIMDRVRKGTIDSETALEQIAAAKKANVATSQTAINAVDYATQQMKTPDFVLRQNPQHLKSAYDNIKSLLSNQDNAYVKKELTTVKQALGHQIGKVAPEFKQAEKEFAEKSVPLNRMQIANALLGKSGSPVPDVLGNPTLYPASYFRALQKEGAPLVKEATGFKNRALSQVMTPDQMATIQGVGKQLQAKTAADNLARSVGSNTAQNLAGQNLLRQLAGPLGFSESVLSGPLAQSVLRPVSWAASATEPTLQAKLAQALMDPQMAASMMEGVKPNQLKTLISELQRFVPGLAVASEASE